MLLLKRSRSSFFPSRCLSIAINLISIIDWQIKTKTISIIDWQIKTKTENWLIISFLHDQSYMHLYFGLWDQLLPSLGYTAKYFAAVVLLLINCLQLCLPKHGTIDLSMLTACSVSIAANAVYFSINSLTLLNLSLGSRVELSARWRFCTISSNIFFDMSNDSEIVCTSAVFPQNTGRFYK